MACGSVMWEWGSLEGWVMSGAVLSHGVVAPLFVLAGVGLVDALSAGLSFCQLFVFGLSLFVGGGEASVQVLAFAELHVVVDISNGDHVGGDTHALVSALDVSGEFGEVDEVVPLNAIEIALLNPSVLLWEIRSGESGSGGGD